MQKMVKMPIAVRQARLLRCIAEPTRLQILRLLIEGEKCVNEIVSILKKEQPLVSYHLRHLRECNIVVTRQEEQKIYYKLSDFRLAELVRKSEALVKEISMCPPQRGSNRRKKTTVGA